MPESQEKSGFTRHIGTHLYLVHDGEGKLIAVGLKRVLFIKLLFFTADVVSNTGYDARHKKDAEQQFSNYSQKNGIAFLIQTGSSQEST